MSKSSVTAVALVLVMVTSGFAVVSMNVAADKGDRDTYGYAWTDSKAPLPSVAFNWAEIKNTGTLSGVLGDSGSGGPFPIGFDFMFYGNRYSTFNISTNGYIQFGGRSSEDYPDGIPDWWSPNNIIALYWDDMDVDGAPQHGIYYETQGVAPNRQLVIEFVNITDYWYSSDHMMMEIILKENGEIWFQYLSLDGHLGSGAVIGIENSDGSVGCEYSYYSSLLEDNMAIRFSYSPVQIGPSDHLIGPPGSDVTYTLTLWNKMAVDDSFAIQTSGVEGWPVSVFDSGMNPLVDTDFDGLVDTGTVTAASTFTILVNVTVPGFVTNVIEYTTVNASAHSDPMLYDACVLSTEESGAWFEPPHLSYATDSDGDGDYNTLTVNASVYVRVEGWYRIWAYLYTESGWYVQAQYAGGTLSVGSQTLTLIWNGWFIRDRNDAGQLRVDMDMYDWSYLQDSDTHYTAYYDPTDFMMHPGVLRASHYDTPIDTDSDGLYDLLMLHVNVTANYAGLFRVTAYMYDADGNDMLVNQTEVDLTAGDHTVDLGYDSMDMIREGGDGPYRFLIVLSAYVRGQWWDLESTNYNTGAYLTTQFKPPTAFFQGPHSELALDTDSDGLYEWLYIYVWVNVTVPDDYVIEGELSARGTHIDTATNSTYLDAGRHRITLVYPGFPIRYVDESDDYDCALVLTDGSTVLDEENYETDWYWWNDFDTAPGRFTGVYECTVQDVDGDGLYDYLLANVTVNVTADGTYEVRGFLYDWWGDLTCSDTNRTYLTADEYVFHFAFPGWMIRAGGEDPDELYFYLYDEDAREMDTLWFWTPSYSYTDFETTPASFGMSGNVLYPQDDDSDGVNETMVMEVNVTVDLAGYYYLSGRIYDDWWNDVGQQRVLVWLDAGNNSVQISFPGWLIRAIGVNGTFWCYAYLYDSNMNSMDTLSFSGGDWYNDFDPTVPRITSTWAYDSPSINGMLGATEWSGAAVVNLRDANSMSDVNAQLLVMNDETMLYIAFDVYGDTTEDAWDLATFSFDTGNDEDMTDDQEDEFTASAVGVENHYEFSSTFSSWVLDCSPFSDTDPDHPGLDSGIGFGQTPGYTYDHRVFEFSIPLALLDASMGDILGFITRSHVANGLEDAYNWTYGCWPLTFSTFTLGVYGELELAYHFSIPPPVTTVSLAGTQGDNSWYTTAVTATLSATGGDGGVDHTEYSLDNGAWVVYTAPIVITTNGTHSLRYRSTDAAAQEEAIKTATIKIDQVVPTTVAGKSGSWVWLNATDGTSGVGIIMYRIDGGSWQTCTGAFNVTGSKGMHTVEYYARDAAGNSEIVKSIQVEVTVGTGGGLSGLLSNPFLWIALIAAIAVVLVLVALVMKRRRGQQPVMYPGPGQPMPQQPQPMPDFPPPPGPPGMG